MAISTSFLMLYFLSLVALSARGQLSDEKFYQRSCPSLHGMVRSTMAKALSKEPRLGASILRVFFHDCFVNGCDASVLLDDTSTFTGEKNALPNKNSLRGFEVIDAVKSTVEAKCKATVSCADILALAARDGVVLLGGPSWQVQLGRHDARTASLNNANTQLPPPFSNLSAITAMFAAKGLNARDMTALSGAHTIGQAQCTNFRTHVYNESNIDAQFAALRKRTCPVSGSDGSLAPLDSSPNLFDNGYFKDLVSRRGLLHSDQELFNGGSQDLLVKQYSEDNNAFGNDFVAAMVKMGSISPLTGAKGEVRLNCRVVN